jgi:hypothetical protein
VRGRAAGGVLPAAACACTHGRMCAAVRCDCVLLLRAVADPRPVPRVVTPSPLTAAVGAHRGPARRGG